MIVNYVLRSCQSDIANHDAKCFQTQFWGWREAVWAKNHTTIWELNKLKSNDVAWKPDELKYDGPKMTYEREVIYVKCKIFRHFEIKTNTLFHSTFTSPSTQPSQNVTQQGFAFIFLPSIFIFLSSPTWFNFHKSYAVRPVQVKYFTKLCQGWWLIIQSFFNESAASMPVLSQLDLTVNGKDVWSIPWT